MAVNKVYKETTERDRERLLAAIIAPSTPPTTIQPGTPVLFPDGGAVALTASGNGTVTQTTDLPPGLTSVTYTNGGVGNLSGAATFAFDGTFDLPVTGALTTTVSGTNVYIVLATGALTLTVGTNTHFGWTDYPRDYAKVAGRAPVRIGA